MVHNEKAMAQMILTEVKGKQHQSAFCQLTFDGMALKINTGQQRRRYTTMSQEAKTGSGSNSLCFSELILSCICKRVVDKAPVGPLVTNTNAYTRTYTHQVLQQ